METLHKITSSAVGRLLDNLHPLSATKLYSHGELEQLADTLAAVRAAGDLMGRSRIRIGMVKAVEQHSKGISKFSEEEARDEKGRWTSDGGSLAGPAADKEPKAEAEPIKENQASTPSIPVPPPDSGRPAMGALEAKRTLVSNTERWAASMNENQKDALKNYATDAGYKDINERMRKCPDGHSCLDNTQKEQLNHIEAAIDSAPALPAPVNVFRGMAMDPKTARAFVKSVKSGKEFSMPSLTSTTLDPIIAGKFSTFDEDSKGLMLVIKANKGVYLGAGGLSQHPSEEELLLSSRAKFKFVEAEKNKIWLVQTA